MEECRSSSEMTSTIEREKTEENRKYFFLDEAYFDNWWTNLDTRVEKKSFGEQEENIFKHSVILKSFRNEYETDSLISASVLKQLMEGKIDLDKKIGIQSLQRRSVEVLVPGYNLNSFIPNTSCLTYNEMIICQGLLEVGAPQNPEQLNIWTMCKSKLEEEQQQYIELAKEQWKADGYKKHTAIKPHIKEFVDLLWKVRLERVYTLPKFYSEIENIALTPSGIEEVELNFVKQLESIGRPARYYIPDLWTFVVNVNSVADSMKKPPVGWSGHQSKNFQGCYKSIDSKLIDSGYNSDVSRDKIAERLAKENGANIVMSSSAFSHLVDNQPLGINSVWNLPVTVIEYPTDRGNKRIVFIDKKLPAMSMTAVDRTKCYAKLALKKLFIRPPSNYRDPATSIYDADSVETFGVDTPLNKVLYRNFKKRMKRKCSYCLRKDSALPKNEILDVNEQSGQNYNSDSEESSGFCIDLNEERCIAERQNSSKEEVAAASINNLSNSTCQETNLCTCVSELLEELSNSPKLKKKKLNYRVMYNLWDFNSSASQNYMSKNCSKDLRVIIRTTAEGQVNEKVEGADEPVQKLYKLSPKLEYQTEFGAEAATLSEILKEWGSVYIRPSSTLARVRLDGMTGELIQIQRFTTSDLAVECQRLYKVNPKDRLASIHTILVKLSDLPAGMYRLHCTPKIGNFVQLLRSVNSGGSQITNLHLQYNKVEPTLVAPAVSPFPALDPAVVTPTFKYFKRIPCTFAPKKNKAKRSLLNDNSAINPPQTTPSRKSKKKKKKKKAKK